MTPTVFKEPFGQGVQLLRAVARGRRPGRTASASRRTASRSSGRASSRSEGTFDEEALAHYEAIVDYCLERGLAPVVTFNHFTAPHWFAMRGGWLDAKAPELFARYCDRLMQAFGHKIAYAVTMNEPNLAARC